MVSSAANFVTTQADKLLFAVLVTSSTLGLYSIALLLKSSVEGVLQRLHGNLSLPVLAETFRERPQEVRRIYYQFRMPLEIAAFFSGGFLMVSGGKIVELLYDDRYLAAGWMLEILAFSLIMYPMQIIGSSFAASGEIQKQAMLSIMNAFSLILLTLVGYGLAGFAGAIVGVAVSKLPAGITAIALAYKRGWIGLVAELRYVPLIGVGLLAGLFVNWLIDVLQ